MKIVFRVIFLAALAALGVWLWTVFFPSPEKIIRRQLDEIAKRASFTANESALARLGTAQSLAGYFSTNAEVHIDTREAGQHDLIGREQIMQTAVAAQSALGSLNVKFLDVKVTVALDKQSATADLTVDANVSGQPDAIVQEVKITFQKINGQWLITRVTTVRVLSILNFEPARALSIVGA
jgi:hypothetical protein